MNIKAGWKTSEFWVTVGSIAGSVVAILSGVGAPWAIAAAATVASSYNVSRSIAKAAGAKVDSGDTKSP